MYIDFNKNTVYILTLKHVTLIPDNPSPSDFISIEKLTPNNKARCGTIWRSDDIYLGTNDDIKRELSKFCHNDLDYKNVYTFKDCNVPTFDLQSKGITRKRSIDSAELVVFPNPSYGKLDYYGGNSKVLYNQINDEFLIVHNPHSYYYFHKHNDTFKNFFPNTKINAFIDRLFDLGIITYDYSILDSDQILLINDGAIFNNLDKIKNAVFEDEYIKYISNDKDPLTYEIIDQVKVMLDSNDMDNINLGLQLLYSFDPASKAYSISKILRSSLQRYQYSIANSQFYKSSKFDKWMSLMGLHKSHLKSDLTVLRNVLFNICDEEDKEIIVSEAFKIINDNLIHSFKAMSYFKFLKDTKIEYPKLIYNETNYFDPGE